MKWTAAQIPDLTGKTYLVTGANSGLGYVTTRELAAKGGHVIMAVRNLDKGRAAMAKLTGSLELKHVDLSDLDSVRALAQDLREREQRIDVLVNNAGIMMPPRTLNAAGHEIQFAANHLGHFALTLLLLGLIEERVVTVSSTQHRTGKIFYDDLDGAKNYEPIPYYAQSKFANVLFGLELHRRFQAAGDPRLSVLAHPGYSATNLQSTGPVGGLKAFLAVTNKVVAMKVDKGALDQLHAAVDPSVRSGQFIGPDGWGEHFGWPKVVQPIEPAKDEADAQRLWTLSERLTGVQLSSADLRK